MKASMPVIKFSPPGDTRPDGRSRLPLCLCVGLAWLSIANANAAGNPHLVSKQHDQTHCRDCHIDRPALTHDGLLDSRNAPVEIKRFKQDGVSMCLPCHSHNNLHADVAAKIDFAAPSDMPLGDGNGHTCLTCHYTHGRLDSEAPRANVNFIDRLFNTERMRKSFLLRRDNSDGGLCLACHNPLAPQ